MSPERAVEIIENLVDGIHPLTGKALPESNICEQTGIVDALNCAIQVLNERIVATHAIEEYRRRQAKVAPAAAKAAEQGAAVSAQQRKPDNADECAPECADRHQLENAGKRWRAEDEETVVKLYQAGTPVKEIARQLRRTEAAIEVRLVMLDLVEPDASTPAHYTLPDPIDNDDLRDRLLHGETIPELAKRYGRSEQSIRARLFYMGFGGKAPDVLPHREKKDQ